MTYEPGTVRDYIDRQAQGPLAAVIGRYGVDSDLTTHLGDYLAGVLHALDAVLRGEDAEDPRAEVVAEVELALKHYLTESYALRIEPDVTEDVLGGYPMPYVEVYAQLDLAAEAS